MKIKILFLVFMFLSVVTLNAQRFGVRAGSSLDNSKVDYNGMDATLYAGFNAGVISDFNLPFYGWKMNAGLLYSYQGFKLKEDYGNNRGVTYHFRTNNIEVPVNIRKDLNLSFVKSFVQAGLYASYALSGKIKDGNKSHSLKFDTSGDRFNIGGSVGVGCYLITDLQLSANYEHGFTKSSLVFGDQIITTKNRKWTLAVGYLF